MSDKNRSNPMKRIDLLSAVIFGEPEEIDSSELEEALQASGEDLEASRSRLYERLRAEAQPYWMAQKDVPPALKNALEEFRPDSAPIRTEKELGKRAESRIARVLDAAAASLLPAIPIGREAFSASFRHESADKSAKDQETIGRLERELLENIEKESDDHEQ
jgi:hypothetical protein